MLPKKGQTKPLAEPASFAFKKCERLLREIEFTAVLKRGKVFRRPPFQFYYLKKESGVARLGIWISKKDFKRAVDRNRLKRGTREWFRLNKKALCFPCDLIIQIGGRAFKGKAKSFDYQNAPAQLEAALREAGVLKA